MVEKPLLTTLQKGLQVLEAVPALAGSETVTAREIASHVGMRRTSVYRYLDTLQEAGFIEQVSDGSEYRLAPKLMRLAAYYLTNLDIRRQSEPVMSELVKQTGLTGHVVVLDHDSIVYVHKVESDSPIQMRSRIGASAPSYCTASGKAILAHVSESHLAEVLSSGLPRRTANTITDPEALKVHLAQVRRQGFALDNVEYEEGIRCIGAPVFGFDGSVVAAISLTGVETDLTLDRVASRAALIRDAAIEISRRMGLSSSTGPQT